MAKNSLMNVIENNDTLEISMYPRGVAGYIFTPQVDKNGNLSWTNNGGLTNPETVNIMGPRGPQGLIEFKIVDSLPETGSSLILYLLSAGTNARGDNLYNEYIWVNNRYELVSEGKTSAKEDAQYVIGYYYNTTELTNLNSVDYLYEGEYALALGVATQNKPQAITTATKIILKTYQSSLDNNIAAVSYFQELINLTDGKKYVRTIEKNNTTYTYGEWTLGTSGGIEIGSTTPTDLSTVLWIDESQEGEIFDPNNYYTKTETNTRINNLNTKIYCLSSGDITLAADTVYNYKPNYANVPGTILGSCLIGCYGKTTNNFSTLIPYLKQTNSVADNTKNWVDSVDIKSPTAQTVCVNILVFYQ